MDTAKEHFHQQQQRPGTHENPQRDRPGLIAPTWPGATRHRAFASGQSRSAWKRAAGFQPARSRLWQHVRGAQRPIPSQASEHLPWIRRHTSSCSLPCAAPLEKHRPSGGCFLTPHGAASEAVLTRHPSATFLRAGTEPDVERFLMPPKPHHHDSDKR